MNVVNIDHDGDASDMLSLPRPYLVFLGAETEPAYAKTAFGLRDWARDDCIGEHACRGATISLGLAALTPAEAKARGARSMVIGVANSGGVIAESWIPELLAAMAAGLDLISGMHTRLEDVSVLGEAAKRYGRRLINVRTPPEGIPIATGRKRTGNRLLTVGTDCALGKKYTALALTRAFSQRGVNADFRATGQTGILIAGGGIPIDAVVSDFLAGAAEMLSPDADAGHWDVIEGQGSVFHPAYAGVALGLLHGSQPDVIVVCHDPGRKFVLGHPRYELPSLEETIALNLKLGARVNPAVRCAGVSLNTSKLDAAAARDIMAGISARLGLPVADPIRGGPEFEKLVTQCLA
ncbi:MAG: DUF1611 domain-containing protein [Pseudomonadota bacterium]